MATDKESLTVVAAPDLDELARLLARKTSAAPGSYECGMASAALRDAAEAALPALLATARRERRYKALLEVARAELDCPHGEGADPAFNYGHRCVMCDDNVDGNMVLRKRIDAALAEEGQDG